MSFFDGWREPRTHSRTRPHGNLTALRVSVIILFALLAVQLFRMQIVDGEEYARRSRENHITQRTILPPRGLIYDRNGEPLVSNTAVYTANITPEFLPEDEDDRYSIYLALEDLLGIPALEIGARVDNAEEDGQPYIEVPLKKNLSRQEALMLEEAAVNLPGVELAIKPGRTYIAGGEFSHILGYIGDQDPADAERLADEGYELNEQIGKAGLESRYEDVLRGTRGIVAAEQDAQGNLIEALDTREAVPGNSLKLSIDAGLQRYVSDLLIENLDKNVNERLTTASTAAAVVMNPNTGEVYAIVSVPSYDNNIYSDLTSREAEWDALLEDEDKPLINKATTPAAPGSVYKIVTAMAALETGHITPQTSFNVASTVKEVKGENGELYPLIDWRAHGWIDLYGGIAWSSNQYMFMASCGILGESRGLGKDSETSAIILGHYARAFGYGETTGIDIGGEDPGIVPDPAWKQRAHEATDGDGTWYYADTCFMGIGQGDVLASPLQVSVMTAAVANGGQLVTPRVASAEIAPGGQVVREFTSSTESIPVSDENLAHVRTGMIQSVAGAAGANAYRPGLAIAGKTGTAQFKKDGVELEHAWFTGYAPYDDPEVVVTVYFDVGVGGEKAAPVAADIMEYFMAEVQR